MKNGFLYAGVGLVVVGGALVIGSHYATKPAIPAPVPAMVAIATSTPIQFEIVTTPVAQEKGLGGRAKIPDNYGMLFVFPEKGNVGFWMKDMLAPIDIIWLADDGKIVGIEASVLPATYPKAFYPPSPVRYVLETRAGFATDHAWTTGTTVPLPVAGK
jgi:hypothetical protein